MKKKVLERYKAIILANIFLSLLLTSVGIAQDSQTTQIDTLKKVHPTNEVDPKNWTA